MTRVLLLLVMIFLHIVDDYYLQGWLASAKQKSWWEKNAPDELYEYDYIMALFMHSFSWTFMVMIIPSLFALSRVINTGIDNINIVSGQIIFTFVVHLIMHIIVDNAKANLKKINLIQDQIIHLIQIITIWFYLVLIRL